MIVVVWLYVVIKANSTKGCNKKNSKASFKVEFYYSTREWPYKNVKPRVIAEKYMEDSSGELTDYKYFCFDGEPKAILLRPIVLIQLLMQSLTSSIWILIT